MFRASFSGARRRSGVVPFRSSRTRQDVVRRDAYHAASRSSCTRARRFAPRDLRCAKTRRRGKAPIRGSFRDGAGKISSEARRATHLLRRDLYQSGERTDASLRGRIERRRHARSSPPSLSPPPPRRALTEAFVAVRKAERNPRDRRCARDDSPQCGSKHVRLPLRRARRPPLTGGHVRARLDDAPRRDGPRARVLVRARGDRGDLRVRRTPPPLDRSPRGFSRTYRTHPRAIVGRVLRVGCLVVA